MLRNNGYHTRLNIYYIFDKPRKDFPHVLNVSATSLRRIGRLSRSGTCGNDVTAYITGSVDQKSGERATRMELVAETAVSVAASHVICYVVCHVTTSRSTHCIWKSVFFSSQRIWAGGGQGIRPSSEPSKRDGQYGTHRLD